MFIVRASLVWASSCWAGNAFGATALCDETELRAVVKGLAGLDSVKTVAMTASAVEDACAGLGAILDAAGDVSAVSPERRRVIDLKLATQDERWRDACPGGARTLSESMRMSPREGRAHLWKGCELQRLGYITEQEWVDGLVGLIVLPLTLMAVLPELGMDDDVTHGIVRGLVGLQPQPRERVKVGMPTMAELAAMDEAELAKRDAPAPAPAPVTEVEAVDLDVPTLEPAEEVLPPQPPVATKARFKEDGRAEPKWSAKARKNGGTCVVRIRVGPNGRVVKVTFLECPDVLQDDVGDAIDKSRFVPASDGQYPIPGAFRTAWSVNSSD